MTTGGLGTQHYSENDDDSAADSHSPRRVQVLSEMSVIHGSPKPADSVDRMTVFFGGKRERVGYDYGYSYGGYDQNKIFGGKDGVEIILFDNVYCLSMRLLALFRVI